MKSSGRSPSKKQRGQSLVELAISLTVLLLLLSGAVTFGMAYFSYVSMRDAAQEGALYGSINPCVTTDGNCTRSTATSPLNRTAIVDRIRSSSTSPVDFSNTSLIPDGYINISLLPSGEPCEGTSLTVNEPNSIQVTVEYDYPIFMPFVGAIVGGGGQTIHLTATVTDTILEPRCPPGP